jgi:hypothetical protein
MSMLPDQPALDAAADDAERIAGDVYYTGCIVHHPGPGKVTLYLAHAPEDVLEKLEAAHPGVYAILNDAPRSQSAVLEIMATLDISGIDAVQFGPTPDGYVQVGILSPFVALAQATMDARYGCGVIRVFETEQAYGLGR